MNDTRFNIALVIRSDTAQGKAGMVEMATGMSAVTAQTEKAGAAARKHAADLRLVTAETAKVVSGQNAMVAAELRSQAALSQAAIAPLANPVTFAPLQASFKATDTAAGSLRQVLAGLNVSVGSQAQDMVEAAAASQAYQMALDDVRASFNPLFAASRQYEQQLDRIAAAEKAGAITTREAAAAREAAASQIAPIGRGGQRPGQERVNPYTANIGAQVFDVGVTATMGMNPAMIGFQQGSQLAGIAQQMGGGAQAAKGLLSGITSVFNMTSLLTIGLTTLSAVGIQALMSLYGPSKTLEDRIAALTTAFDRYKASTDIAGMSSVDLAQRFGAGEAAARGLYGVLSDLNRMSVDQHLKDTSNAMRELIGMTDPTQRARNLTGFFGLGTGASQVRKHSAEITSFDDALKGFETAEGIDAQSAALQIVLEQVRELTKLDGDVSEQEQGLIDLIKTRGDVLLGIQAAETARAEATTRQVDQLVLGYQQEAALLAATSKYGAESVQVEKLKGQHARENLAIRLQGMGVEEGTADWRRAHVELAIQLAAQEQILLDTQRAWVAEQQDRLAGVTREISLIGSSNAERSRANALAEADIEIRKRKLQGLEAEEHRIRAIAQAEADALLERQKALYDIGITSQMDGYDRRIAAERNPQIRAQIEAEKEYARQIAAGADATVAAAASEQVRAKALGDLRQEQADYLRGQRENLQHLQLELALIGQTEEVRARVLALVQAEQDIQRLGLTGDAAENTRKHSLAQADLAREIEAQADAWQRVQSAGEDAIDGVLDKLRGGDIKGAFSELLGEIEGMFFDLNVRNPLKNLLMGTNLGTWNDVGGLSGIWGRLTGQNRVDERVLAAQATAPVQSMMVTAASVTIGGAGAANLLSISSSNGAGYGASPGFGGAGALPGSGDVQSQIWAFFQARGLQPHQIAGIMGNVAAESGFDPLAQGDHIAGVPKAFGLFQHNNRRGQLFDFIGGQENLGNVQAQLEFAWKELMTSENGAFRKLQASTNVYDATHAFTGFERPSGYNANTPQAAHGWDRRLAGAEAALSKFEGTSITAQAQLGQLGTGAQTLGTGMQQMTAGLAGTLQQIGAGYGPGGAFIGGLLGEGLKLLTGGGAAAKPAGFRSGGYTGAGAPDDVAGVVHAGEYVFDASATRRLGVANLEALRSGHLPGYRDGGYVVGGVPPVSGRAAQDRMGGGAAAEAQKIEVHLNVSGTGNAEVREAMALGMQQMMEYFERDIMPGRVRAIVNDRWGE